MRGFQWVALAAVAAVSYAFVASAADMPIKAPVKTPPVYSWTGCYVGAQAGYGWGKQDWQAVTDPTTYLSSSFNVGGGLLGGQFGCNYQFPTTTWLVGVEVSAAAASIKGSGTDQYQAPLWADTAKVSTLGSVTGRLGWNGWKPQHLFYAKGGWAWAKDEYANSCCDPSDTPTVPNQYRYGWTLGAGWEWAFARNWSAVVEYDHYDFGSTTPSFAFSGGHTYLTNIKQTVDTIKVGVNFHIDLRQGLAATQY